MRAVIVAGGLTPNAAVLNQLLLALNARYALAGGAMATVLSTAGVPYGFQIGPLIVQFVKQYIGNPAVDSAVAMAPPANAYLAFSAVSN